MIVALLILVAVLAPFTTDADLDTKVATAAINLAIGSLVPGVARSAIRLGSGRPPPGTLITRVSPARGEDAAPCARAG